MRTRCSLAGLVVAAGLLAWAGTALAQSPTYGLGRAPTAEELRPHTAPVGPDGQGLPAGSGTAKQGATAYVARNCGWCHGPTGEEGPGPSLVGAATRYSGGVADIPFAPLIWHAINTMMPLNLQHRVIQYEVRDPATRCCLTPDEVYSLTAYLLYRNGIIGEDDVMDAETLPAVQMPNRSGYAPPPYIDSTWKRGLRKELVK